MIVRMLNKLRKRMDEWVNTVRIFNKDLKNTRRNQTELKTTVTNKNFTRRN